MSGEKLGEIQPIGYIQMPGTNMGANPSPATAPAEQVAVGEPAPPAAPAPTGARPAAEQPAVAAQAPRARFGPKVRLGTSAYVSEHASVLGDVTIGEDVFVAPGASIRGDSGSPIHIGSGSNVQDGVVIHCYDGRSVAVRNQRYAVYVGERVSLGHRCLVHGPVAIEDDAFIGFGAMIENCTIGRGTVVMHLSYVTGVEIPAGRLVSPGTVVESDEQAEKLPVAGRDYREMADRVVQSNRRFAREYGDGTRR